MASSPGLAQSSEVYCIPPKRSAAGNGLPHEHTPANPTSVEQVLIEHLPQVRFIARGLWGRTRFYVELDDLIGYGILGLLDAVRKFDPSRGVLLKTYAEHRIRGAILDGLRAMDWLSRSARRDAKACEQESDGYQERISPHSNVCFTEEGTVWRGPFFPQARYADGLQSFRPNQEVVLEQKQRRNALADAIEILPERQKKVLEMYYQQELSMRQIAAQLGIHESRVSQLHLAAITRLRKLMSPKASGLRELVGLFRAKDCLTVTHRYCA